jgi:hypothetical protein
LLGVALAQNQISEAVDHARGLLEPMQQRLPDALAKQLELAIRTWEANDQEAAAACLDRAVGSAQEMGYL